MTRRLLIVRHGETAQNAERRMVSTTETVLSDAGRAEVERLAEGLSSLAINRIWTSPRLRCRQTTEIIAAAQAASVEIVVDERLVEVGMGAIEGLAEPEIIARGMGDVFRGWRQGVPASYPAGAENFDDAARRIGPVFDEATADTAACTLIVGHSHALRILLATAVLGLAGEAHRLLRLYHGTYSEIQWEQATPRLVALNRSAPR